MTLMRQYAIKIRISKLFLYKYPKGGVFQEMSTERTILNIRLVRIFTVDHSQKDP